MIRRIDPIFVLLSAFLFWKAWFLWTNNHLAPDGAVIGLMARHILEGQFPIFFYGYGYIGSLKSFIAAGLFLIFGVAEKILLLLPALFYIGFVWTTYWLGTLLGGRKTGRIAMLLTLVCSHWLTLFSAEIVGGYIDTLFYGNLLLIFLHKFSQAEVRIRWRWSLALGLVGGLAFWQFPLSGYYLATVVFCLFVLRPRNIFSRHLVYFLGAFFIGSFPLWWYNWNHDFITFGMVSSTEGLQFFKHIINLFKHYVPAILGWDFKRDSFWGIFSWPAIMILFYGSLFWLVNEIRWKWRDARAPILFLFIFVVLLFARNDYAGARSAMVVAPLLLIFPAVVGLSLEKLSHLTKIIFWATLLLMTIAYGNETKATMLGREQNAKAFRQVQDHFIEAFGKAGLDRVFSPYYLGTPLSFRTGEKVILCEFHEEPIPGYQNHVSAASQPGFALPKGQAVFFKRNLSTLGCRFKEKDVENHKLFYEVDRARNLGKEISTEGWIGDPRAFDRDIMTRWSTEKPQKPGQPFTVELSKEHRISGVEIRSLKDGDLPRVLKIEISKNGENWKEVCLNPFFPYSLYWSGNHPFVVSECGRIEIAFQPTAGRFVRFTQKGTAAENYWSIHELFLYEEGAEISEEQARKNLEDVKSSTDTVLAELAKKKGHPLYTDSWLSAHLALLPKAGFLQFLHLHNPRLTLSNLFPRGEILSRFISLEKQPVFVIEKEGVDDFEKSAQRENVSCAKKDFGAFVIYETTSPAKSASGLIPIARDRWRAEASLTPERAHRAIDAKLGTAWNTVESQKAGMFYLLDLGQEEEIKELRLHVGKGLWEYPRHFELFGSNDKQNWRKLPVQHVGVPYWDGKRILNSLLENQWMKIQMETTRARYLKMILTEDERTSQWSLADIQLYH